MNLLAFDTSTEKFHVAVQRGRPGAHPPLEHQGAGGALASANLIPAVLELLARAGLQLSQLDAIVFGRGPGSFTGLRTACSVAQGLAFGAGVPVLGVDTLLAVAEDAHHRAAVDRVVAVLDARMSEVYSASYFRENGIWRPLAPASLGRPEDLLVPQGWCLAGNAFTPCEGRLPWATVVVEAIPTASALLRLAPALVAAGQAGPAARAMPLYIRDKVAQTTHERATQRGHP